MSEVLQVASHHVDAIMLEVLRHKYQAITEEMCYTLQRTGHTVFVNETADFSTGLATPDGELFAYPQSIGVSVMVNANLAVAISTVGSFDDGDIIITNDPYTSGGLGSHLPDTNIFRPIFFDGNVVAFAWAYVHSTDVGGKMPGSLSPSSSDVFQEGIRIPPSKLYRAGKLDHSLMRILQENCRVPADNWGDIKAVISAVNIGADRVIALNKQYGTEIFRESTEALLNYADSRAQDVFSKIPDGVYEFTDYLDNDVITDDPVRLHVGMEVHSGRLRLNLQDCDVQSRSAFNVASCGRPHPWLVYRLISFLYTMDPSIPINGGLLRSIEVITRPGSIVDCSFPAAMGLRTTTSIRLMDALHGALTKAIPGFLPAASAGVMAPVVVAETDFTSGKHRVQTVEPLAGGTGAGPGSDGIDGRDVGLANLRNTPIEIVDSQSNIVIRKYVVATDSGGPGEFRGGAGVVLEFEARQPETMVTARGMERQRFRAWGLGGGRPGGLALAVLNPGTPNERIISKLDGIVLNQGDVLRLQTSGGGGFGDPFKRDPKLVLADVQRASVSISSAASDYGVVIMDGVINIAETVGLRAKQRGNVTEYNFGSEREAYESAWPEQLQHELLEMLYTLPTALRFYAREKLIRSMDSKVGIGYDSVDLQAAWAELGMTLEGVRR